jgi:hypothetical protein
VLEAAEEMGWEQPAPVAPQESLAKTAS